MSTHCAAVGPLLLSMSIVSFIVDLVMQLTYTHFLLLRSEFYLPMMARVNSKLISTDLRFYLGSKFVLPNAPDIALFNNMSK